MTDPNACAWSTGRFKRAFTFEGGGATSLEGGALAFDLGRASHLCLLARPQADHVIALGHIRVAHADAGRKPGFDAKPCEGIADYGLHLRVVRTDGAGEPVDVELAVGIGVDLVCNIEPGAGQNDERGTQ